MSWSTGWTETTELYDINHPYEEIEYEGINYTNCRDFGHISRYKGLRQVIHNPVTQSERFIALETVNAFKSNAEVEYYEVPTDLENRLDIIAYKKLGSAQYSWIVAYFNNIEDGFSCYPGQVLMIPKSVSSLFSGGEVLSTVTATSLNLGSE